MRVRDGSLVINIIAEYSSVPRGAGAVSVFQAVKGS